MYSWGNNNATAGVPTINSHNFNGTTGVMTTMQMINNAKCNAPTGSPLTGTSENMTAFFDSGQNADQLFLGVSAASGRVCRWAPPPANNATAPTANIGGITGGPGGIVVDGETDSVVQRGSIFFGTGNKSNCGGGTSVYCIYKMKQADLSTN
jgi:hypothetical protein